MVDYWVGFHILILAISTPSPLINNPCRGKYATSFFHGSLHGGKHFSILF